MQVLRIFVIIPFNLSNGGEREFFTDLAKVVQDQDVALMIEKDFNRVYDDCVVLESVLGFEAP